MSDENNNGADSNVDPNAKGDDQKKTGTEGADDGKGQRKTFDKDVQDFVNSKYDEAFGKGFEKARTMVKKDLEERDTRITSLTTQIEDLKKKMAATPTKETAKTDEGKDSEEMALMRSKVDQMQSVIDTLKTEKEEAQAQLTTFAADRRETRLRSEFLKNIPEGTTFFDNEEVFGLVRGDLDLNDRNEVYIKNPKTGTPRLGQDLQTPMTLREYLSDFAERKKHHVKAADAGGGTGAGEQRRTSTKPDAEVDFDKMDPATFQAFTDKIKRSGQ